MEPHMGRAVGSGSLSAVGSVISAVSEHGRGSFMSSWLLFSLGVGETTPKWIYVAHQMARPHWHLQDPLR